MSNPEQGAGPDVRMNVKVSGREFPLLADELVRQPKGPRRTNRLAHLATLGLCWEHALRAASSEPEHSTPLLAVPNRTDAPLVGSGCQPYRSRLAANQLAALFEREGL